MIAPGNRLSGRLFSGDARPWLVLAVVLFAAQITWWWVPTRDGCGYLSIARAMSEGELTRYGSPHLHFAPGYPLLVSPTFLASPRPFLLLSLVNFALVVLMTFGVLRWMRQLVGNASPVLMTLVLANAGLWALYRATLSEIQFMTALVWSAALLAALPERPRLRAYIPAALLLAAATLTRHAGVTLAAGACVAFLLAARRRHEGLRTALGPCLVTCLPALVVFALLQWQDRVTATQVGDQADSYARLLGAGDTALPARLLEGLRLRVSEIARLMIPGMTKASGPSGSWLHAVTLVAVPVTAGVAWGWWRLARGRADPLLWSFPLYLLLYVLWPFDQGVRFLVPMLPVIVVSAWRLLEGRPHRRLFFVGLTLSHLGVSLAVFVSHLDIQKYDTLWPDVDRVAEFVEPTPEHGATLALDRKTSLLFQFALDRPVQWSPLPESLARDTAWVVLPRDDAPPSDFSHAKEIGVFVVAAPPETPDR